MKGSKLFLLLVLTILFTGLPLTSFAQVTADPYGFSVAASEGDELETTITLHNAGDSEVNFNARLKAGLRNLQQQGAPLRDDPGDVIQQVELAHNGAYGISRDAENGSMWVGHVVVVNGGVTDGFWTEYAWDGNELGDVLTDIHPEDGQYPLGGTYYDGILYAEPWQNQYIMRYDTDGNRLENIQLNGITPMGFCVDPETEYLYAIILTNVNIIVLDINDNFNQVASIDNVLGHGGDGDFRARMCWVPEHDDGHIWISYEFDAYQLSVDEDWNVQEVQHFDAETDVRSFGIGHDGENLWIGNTDSRVCSIVDDGIVEPNWITIDPVEGAIAPGEDGEITATILPVGLDAGVYNLYIITEFDDPEIPPISMSVILAYETPFASISGRVVEPGTDDPIEGIAVSSTLFNLIRWTDENGAYSFEDLPLGEYEFSFSNDDYLTTIESIDLGEDGAELNVELFHSECNLSTDRIDTELAPDTDSHLNFDISNDGNGPLTYSIERRLLGDANTPPWERRASFDLTQTFEDDRIEGVAFDGDNFYFSGANGADPNMIYIADREGQSIGEFVQPGESRYGMKDLEWDGELLWGGADQDGQVFGFDVEGNVQYQFRGPFNPTGNIAYDSDRDVLWLSGTTTNIAGYTKDGEATGVVLNRRGLRIYGLSYWPGDPDGYPLYILNSPEGGVQLVHKMNPDNGDTMTVINLQLPANFSAGGTFITNTFDIYSWVMMLTNNAPVDSGGDKAFIYQLGARKEWFLVDPTDGVIEAGEAQEFDLHFNALHLPAELFEGELYITHDGIGSATILPISLDVVEGPVHALRNISLMMGWNLISADLQPDPADFVELCGDLVNDRNLIMVKDDQGNFYRPADDFSNMDDWSVSEGYWLKVLTPASISVEGMTVVEEEPINLDAGWQSVAFYPRRPVDATLALTSIEESLIIAKDGEGNFYMPAYGFSTIGNMIRGKGYQIKTSEAVELVYQNGLNAASQGYDRFVSVYDKPGHYPLHIPTGSNMSVLVRTSLADGTDIGIYSGDQLVGCGVIQHGMAGIAVWGDDPSSIPVDGAIAGDQLTIRMLDDLGERNVLTTSVLGEIVFTTDGIAVVNIAAESIPVEFGLTGAYPNPFNSRLTVNFGLSSAGEVNVGLYDLSGREVIRLSEGRMSAGLHSVTLSGENIASGLYILRIESSGNRSQMKVTLLK